MAREWFKINSAARRQPTSGTWSDWKDEIAVDCGRRCIYCCISEVRFGGIRNFHVEHFRPKGVPRFKNLEKVIQNLYYACSICNTFKSDDWPADPIEDHSVASYVDPAKYDYNTIFFADIVGSIGSNYVSGRYMIERIFLNRPQLIVDRRVDMACEETHDSISRLAHLATRLLEIHEITPQIKDLLREVTAMLKDLSELPTKLLTALPYKVSDVTRPAV